MWEVCVLYYELHWGSMRYFNLFRRNSASTANRPTSEPASEPDDNGCQAGVSHMGLPIKLTALRQKPCDDPVCDPAPLLADDHLASRLPSAELSTGLPLRRAHRGIYQTLRPNQACAVLQCVRLGGVGPRGQTLLRYSNVCVGDGLPAPDGHRVKFPHGEHHPDAPSQGLHNIPNDAQRSPVQKLPDEEEFAGSEIAQRLTDEYGGELSPIALSIYRIHSDSAPSSFAPNQRVDCKEEPQADHDPPAKQESAQQKAHNFDVPPVKIDVKAPQGPAPIKELPGFALQAKMYTPPQQPLHTPPVPRNRPVPAQNSVGQQVPPSGSVPNVFDGISPKTYPGAPPRAMV